MEISTEYCSGSICERHLLDDGIGGWLRVSRDDGLRRPGKTAAPRPLESISSSRGNPFLAKFSITALPALPLTPFCSEWREQEERLPSGLSSVSSPSSIVLLERVSEYTVMLLENDFSTSRDQ